MKTEALEMVATADPLWNEDAEQFFVGGLLRWSQAFDLLEPPVPVNAILNPKLRLVYAAMMDLREDDEPIDAVTLQARIDEKGWTDQVGERTLETLEYEVLTGANVPYHAAIIMADWKRRQAVAYAIEAVRDLQDRADPNDVIAKLEHRLSEIAAERTEPVLFDARDVAEEVVADLKRRKAEGRTAVGVPTGFYDLDNLTSGFCPAEMFVIGARPSQGKTALAANMLYNASAKAPVLFVSIEMHRGPVIQRMLSGLAGVDSLRIRHAAVSDDEISQLHQASKAIPRGRFIVADIPGATIADVIQAARQTKRERPDLAVVAVDYVQLIRPEHRHTKQYDHVTDVSRRLKALSRSLGVCVVAICQLNRNPEARGDKRPSMGDLRDSGQIEQDADVIALLHRPEQNDPNQRPGEADLIVCKVRSGPIGDVRLTFDKATTTFRSAAHSWHTGNGVPTNGY